jgi:hypothetical protein
VAGLEPLVDSEDVHLANDTEAPRESRCRGVFSLFSSRVIPGMSSSEVHVALLQPNWIQEAEIVPIYFLAGLLPVEMTSDGTVFRLSLFDPLGEEEVKWLIFLRLDGGQSLGEEDLIEFLSGETESATVIGEYALCFPGQPVHDSGWIQRYTPEGMETLDWY